MGIIYGLFDPRGSLELNEIRYVGQTVTTPHDRRMGHVYIAKRGSKSPVACWIRKLLDEGTEPALIVLDELDNELLDEKEIHWISEGRRARWRLLNVADGGKSRRGYVASAETVAKIVKKNTGQKRSDEQRKRISESLKGKPKSAEHGENISRALTGKEQTTAQKEASILRRNVALSEYVRQRISAGVLSSPLAQIYWRSMVGRKLSNATRLAISNANTGNPKIIAAAKLGGRTFKEKYESDPEFAKTWRDAQKESEAARHGGQVSGKIMTARRARCNECGKVSHPPGIARHQSASGHLGTTQLNKAGD